MADVFISYSSKDRELIQAIAMKIENAGWSVWWDRKLIPGEEFSDEIEAELALSKCVIVIWTKNSVQSMWVKAEAHEALGLNKLVPIMIGSTLPPLVFRQHHTLNLPDTETLSSPKIFELISSLSDILGSPKLSEQIQKEKIAEIPQNHLQSETIYVGPNEEHSTITQAIESCKSNAKIIVKPGSYHENLKISKDIFLVSEEGKSQTHIYGQPNAQNIECQSQVTLFGFSFHGTDANVNLSVKSGALSIDSCQVSKGNYGIQISGSGVVRLSNSIVEGCLNEGISVCDGGKVFLRNVTVRGNNGHGIAVFRSSSITVKDSFISLNNDFGMAIQYDSDAKIENCIIESNTVGGIEIRNNCKATVKDCKVNLNRQGLRISYSSEAIITESFVSNSGMSGIFILNASKAIIKSNKINKNGDNGVYIFDDGIAQIRNNSIHHNTLAGIQIRNSYATIAENNQIFGNQNCGIVIWEGGKHQILDNSIVNNGGSGLVCDKAQDIIAKNGNISNNNEAGVQISNGSNIHVKNIKLYKNSLSGFISLSGSEFQISDTNISNNVQNGIYSKENSYGEVNNSKIDNNGFSGIASTSKSKIDVENCEVSYSQQLGIHSYSSGKCRVRNSLIDSSFRSGVVSSQKDSKIWLYKCKIINSNLSGIKVLEKGEIEIVECDIKSKDHPALFVGNGSMALLCLSNIESLEVDNIELEPQGNLIYEKKELQWITKCKTLIASIRRLLCLY